MTSNPLTTVDATNVLVSEGPLSGTSVQTLATATETCQPSETNVLWMSLTQSVSGQLKRVDDAFEGRAPAKLALVAVDESEPSSDEFPSLDSTPVSTRLVPSPENVTELGVALSHYLNAWQNDEDRLVVGVDSVTALLRYTSLDEAYRFLNVMTNRLESVGCAR